jgi:hypothetical protein
MGTTNIIRPTRSDMAGNYELRGSYRLVASTGAITTVAARTSTAGHIFSFRWAPASLTTYNAYIRYVGARFVLTTAYSTDQETGVDLIVARAYTASHTGATAIDLGSTVTNTNKFATAEGTSLAGVAGHCRIGDTGALTAGTQVLDANPIGLLSDFSTTIGDTVPLATSGGGYGTLWDARPGTPGFGQPLVLADDEGFVLRNTILMGTAGVGTWTFVVEWDEGKPVT